MRLYLVRHPRPRVAPGICYGRMDLELAEPPTALGASLAAQLPAGLPVWSSPLQRCRKLAAELNSEFQVDPRLAEIHFGEWEGRLWEDIGPEALDAWSADISGHRPPGGESPLDLQARALAAVVSAQASGCTQMAWVTHAGVIRVLLGHWLSMPPAAWLRLGVDYGAVTRVDLDPDGPRLRWLNRL